MKHQRKTNSYYGDSLKKALLQHGKPWLKSEELPEYSLFYVGEHLIEELRNNSNHLVVGRRGTGKTHLFGAFKETVERSHDNELVVMTSILDLAQSPLSPEGISPEFHGRRVAGDMFRAFLDKFANHLFVASESYLKIKVKPFMPNAQYKIIGNAKDKLFLELWELIELGYEYPTSQVAVTQKNTTLERKAGFAGNGEAVLSRKDLSFQLGAKSNIERNSNQSTSHTMKIESIVGLDLGGIRSKILDILKALDVKNLYILIDEWMELDKNTPSDIQPYFAQLLKVMFFNSKVFAVKIASVWHQTTLYDKKGLERSKGIQLGQDIQIGVDLDTAFTTKDDDVYEFYKNLLYKRLDYVCPDIHYFKTHESIDDGLVRELFDNNTNFKAFIASTHGIPRDIMAIFQKCSLKIKRNFSKQCIDIDLINEISSGVYNTQKRKNIEPGSDAQLLLNKLNHYMENTGRRIFLVKNTQVKYSASLRKLCDEEIIHQVPSAVTSREVRDTCKAFLIDYGNFIDWATTKKLKISEMLLATDYARILEQSEIDSVIDVPIERLGYLDCAACLESFSPSHPVYKNYSICPNCSERIQEIAS